jgi:3-dehydroquinate synthetase
MENILTKFDNYKRTWSVKTELPIEFVLKYSSDIFDVNNHDLLSFNESNRKIVVIDKTVNQIYGDRLQSYFDTFKIELKLFEIDAVEENKDWQHADEILKFFENLFRKKDQ